MILSEKITELRKRCGLSQEQLGEQIGVSRQAVSKWEMAQSVPDTGKIVALADVFGVPTDILLRDDMGPEALGTAGAPAGEAAVSVPLPEEPGRRMLSMEEVSAFLAAREGAARKLAAVILMFFVSPFAGILLSGAGDGRLGIVGAIIEVIVLTGAAVLLVLTLYDMRRCGYMRDAEAELAYGVRGAVEERRAAFEHTHLLGIVLGIVLLLCSVVPMMICAIFTDAAELAVPACGCLMMLLIAAGAVCIVYVCFIYRGFSLVLRHR